VDVPSSRLHLPDHVYRPDPWMPDTGRPPGPLAVLSAAKRASWFGTRKGWYGVSAVNGSYHWVDLPLHVASSVQPVLSPDGTKVGYAFTGKTPGKQFSPVVGFAVYDTRNGHVSTWRIPTRHGLEAESFQVGWSPDSQWFAADFGQTVTNHSANDFRLLAFPVSGAAAVAQDQPDYCCISPPGRSGAHTLTWFGDPPKRVYLDRPGQGQSVWFGIDRAGEAGPWFSPDGRRFVFVAEGPAGPHSTTFRLYVGNSVPPSARTTTRLFSPRLQPYTVLGWIDNRHVAVDAHVSGGDGFFFFAVDTRTGEYHQLMKLGAWSSWLATPQVAADLLGNPLVPGVRPHVGLDPRLPAGGAAAVLVLAVFGVWFWRRCVGA
jgi:hypothetical protein